jgi:N utilization substance protein B
MTNNKKRVPLHRLSKPIGRTLAMQFLFQFDMIKEDFDESSLVRFFNKLDVENLYPVTAKENRKGRKYASKLIYGCMDKLDIIDKSIASFLAKDWNWNRIASVDKAILRVATYEMLFANNIPPVVVINEAVEISKKFGSYESKAFVNAVLNNTKNHLNDLRKEFDINFETAD